MRALLAGMLCALLWAATASAAAVVITNDRGGSVSGYRAKYAGYAAQGLKIRIEGPCLSACTLLTIYIPNDNICIMPAAVLGFHAERNGYGKEDTLNNIDSLSLTFEYPQDISNWLMNHGGSLQPEMVFMRYDDLRMLYRDCS